MLAVALEWLAKRQRHGGDATMPSPCGQITPSRSADGAVLPFAPSHLGSSPSQCYPIPRGRTPCQTLPSTFPPKRFEFSAKGLTIKPPYRLPHTTKQGLPDTRSESFIVRPVFVPFIWPFHRPAASTVTVGSAPSHRTSAVGPYVDITALPINLRYTVNCVL